MRRFKEIAEESLCAFSSLEEIYHEERKASWFSDCGDLTLAGFAHI